MCQRHRRPVVSWLHVCLWTIVALLIAAACSNSTGDGDAAPPTTERRTVGEQAAATTSVPPTTETIPPTTTEPTDPLAVHVAPDGDDLASGTESRPFASIEHALTIVDPGGTIFLGDGEYAPFVIEDHGDVTITSRPGERATVIGASYAQGPGITVRRSSGIRLVDLDVTRVLWGVWLESSVDIQVVGNSIFDLGQEGVMVKQNSSQVRIEDNTIFDTGQREGENRGRPFSDFGEAIYVGNAGPLDDGTNDESNDIVIRGNTIYNTTAEAIDIKSWTDDILVENNLIYDVDTATSGAIVVGIGETRSPATNIVIRANVIHDVTRTSQFDHGNAIVISAPATVTGNVIWNVQHYGILVDRRLGSTETADVIINNNLVASSGLDAIAQLTTNPSVPVTVEGNVTGADASALLGTPPSVSAAWTAVESLSAS